MRGERGQSPRGRYLLPPRPPHPCAAVLRLCLTEDSRRTLKWSFLVAPKCPCQCRLPKSLRLLGCCPLDKVQLHAGFSLTLRLPFPSDLNAGLGGRKRRKRSIEAGLVVLIVRCIGCGLVSNRV